MPDVIIWMISGEKRIAYYRIPAHTLLYSKNPMYCGKECGKIQAIQMKVSGITDEGSDNSAFLLKGSGRLIAKMSASQPRDHGFEPHIGHNHDSS